MGSWGIGLWANDAAQDLRALLGELIRLPLDEGALIGALLDELPAARDPADEDYPDLWLALADLFHAYGLAHPDVEARIHDVVEDGRDVEIKRALGMSENDLAKRGKALAQLAAKWSVPNPKPRRRRMLSAPEPLLFEAGDCVIFPTMKGNAANVALSTSRLTTEFVTDGFGAFAVLGNARRHGYLACYRVARLHLACPAPPTIEQCLAAPVSALKVWLPFVPPDPAVKVTTASEAEARKLGLAKIGTLSLDQAALRAAFPHAHKTPDRPSWSLAGLLRPYSEGKTVLTDRPVPLKMHRLTRFASID